MTPLIATLFNAAIANFNGGNIPAAAIYIWALNRFADASTTRGLVDAFRGQLLSVIEAELTGPEPERAMRLDRLSGLFEMDIAERLDPSKARRHAARCVIDARNALLERNLEGVLAYSLAALAFERENIDAARLLAAAVEDVSARCQILDKDAPTLEGTLWIAVGAALAAPEPRRLLLDLLKGLGDIDSLAFVGAQIASDESAAFSDRIEAMKARQFAEHRRRGDDAAAAEDKAKADVRDHLVALGPAAELDDAALIARIFQCFDYGGYRRTLADLRELRRRRPDDDWVAFNLCVILFNALHPDVAAAADQAARHVGDDVRALETGLNMMSMMGAVPQALRLAERLTAHIPDYAMVGELHQMATDLDARPAAAFGRGRQGRGLLYANLVCWGEAYIDLMEQASIASLLAPGNVPELVEHVDLVVELFTMPGDLPRLLRSAPLKRLSDYCEIRIHVFSDAVATKKKDWSYDIYGHSLHATALRAERDGAAVTFLMPDILYADGGYGLIGRKATSGRRAIFVDSLNTYAAPMLDRMRPFRQGDALVVSPADLIDAAVGCLTKRTLHSLYQPGDRQTCAQPTRVIFPLESGLRTHAFIMTPIYVSHAALAPFIMRNFRTHDGLMSEHVLNRVDDEELEVLSATEFCYVEVCDNDGLLNPIVDGDLASTIRAFFVTYGLSRHRIRLFERPIDFPTRSPPDLPLVTAEEAAARVREVQQMFATDPLLVDVAEEQERLRAALYRQ